MNSETADPGVVPPYRGIIYYDRDCSLCLSFVHRFHRILEKRGYHFAPLQAEGVAQRLRLPPEELLKEVRLLTVEERLISGGDVFIHLAHAVWWARPFYFLSRLPGMRPIIRSLYQFISHHRHRLS